MRILLTNHHLNSYSGTEVYTYTLAVALQKAGHEVTVYTKFPGVITDKLREEDIRWTDSLESIKDLVFDIGHIHHLICAYEVRLMFPKLPLIFQAHGVGIKAVLEQPPVYDIHISHFLAISEQVERRLHVGFYKKSISIARNGFDTHLFHSTQPINERPKCALILSNTLTAKKKAILTKALDKLGMTYIHLGAENSVPNEILPRFINQADIVCAIGRGAVEALLCKRAVFIFDRNSADGMVTLSNYESLKQTHFSGLTNNRDYTSAQIVKEIKDLYDPDDSKQISALARKDFDIEVTLNTILPYYERAIKSPPRELPEKTKILIRQNLELIKIETLYATQELKTMQDSKMYGAWKIYNVLKKLTKLQRK